MEFEHPRKWVQEDPHKPALIMATSGQVVTRGQLEESANRCAHMLRDLGLQSGDNIAIYMENDPRFMEIACAAGRSGLLYTPISTHLTVPEVEYIVNDCQAKVFVTSVAKGSGDMPAWGDVLYPEELDALWDEIKAGERRGTVPQ